jgi:hypothetical protein
MNKKGATECVVKLSQKHNRWAKIGDRAAVPSIIGAEVADAAEVDAKKNKVQYGRYEK